MLGTGGGAFMNAETRALDQSVGGLGVDQGRFRTAVRARATPLQPAAAQDRQPAPDAAGPDRQALPDLCRSRCHGGHAATSRRTRWRAK